MDSGHTKMKVSSCDKGKKAGSLADNVIKEGSVEGWHHSRVAWEVGDSRQGKIMMSRVRFN